MKKGAGFPLRRKVTAEEIRAEGAWLISPEQALDDIAKGHAPTPVSGDDKPATR